MGLKLQQAQQKTEDEEMMTDGLAAIISENKKGKEALGKKNSEVTLRSSPD